MSGIPNRESQAMLKNVMVTQQGIPRNEEISLQYEHLPIILKIKPNTSSLDFFLKLLPNGEKF